MKRSFEFDTLFSDIEQRLEERKDSIKPIKFKVCSECKQKKPIFKFSVNKRNLEGRTNICKECRSREYLRYYYQNRERILIKCKEYRDTDKGNRSAYSENYRKDNRERLKKKAGEWYKKNRKAIKKRNLKYYQENKEACLAIRELWREKNKEGIKKYNREYKRKQRIKNKN
jgi:post-segregation antitoxin (ccd killing protein)